MATRLTQTWFVVLDPVTLDGEQCPDCGFDAVLTFPVHYINETGVGPFGMAKSCTRCWDAKGNS
jgi:hypothetical protein